MPARGIRHAAISLLVLSATLSPSHAQPVDPSSQSTTDDRVWLQPLPPTTNDGSWYPRPIEIIRGQVLDLDADQLRLQLKNGDQQLYDAARVIWIEPAQVPQAQREILAAFAEADHAAVLSKLPAVLQARPPVWRQQWLTMVGACAAWQSSRGPIALELVSQLDGRPLPPLAISWLPIAWSNGGQTAAIVTAAKQRLQDPSPLVQLVAASWLLSSPDRNEAWAVLQGLQQQTQRPVVAQLAECLLWRTVPPAEVIQQQSQWLGTLDQLPLVLQSGPTLTLAGQLRSAGQTAAADSLQWSLQWTPIHPHPAVLIDTEP